MAAASGGKEELKQAAKRVREAWKKPVAQADPQKNETAPEGEGTIETLRQRVASLTAENMQLREQLARLQSDTAARCTSPGSAEAPALR